MDRKTLSKLFKIPLGDLNERQDGRIEWICKHGVGHTIYAPGKPSPSDFVHGCDGCCINRFGKVNIEKLTKWE